MANFDSIHVFAATDKPRITDGLIKFLFVDKVSDLV